MEKSLCLQADFVFWRALEMAGDWSSDNGAGVREGPTGRANECLLFNGIHDDDYGEREAAAMPMRE